MLPNVLRPSATDHVPVLAEEVREALAVRPGETVVDATFGAGGHAALLAADLRGKGKLIAIEGTDGVGRSTQIQLLRQWLEVRGYGVIETGWTRSMLMQPTIELAKSSNTLNKLTFVLLYATDFADRLEKEIIPALKAGF